MEKTIEDMPKIVLHLHLDGSLRAETVYKWLQEQGTNLSLEEVRKQLMVARDCRNLNEYLEKFDLPIKVLQTAEHIEEATFELFENLAKDNVIYAEVRFAPSKHLENGLTYDDVVAAAIRGMESAKNKYNIDGSLILCCMRGENEKNHLETLNVAKKFLNQGICAIDLAGAEALFPTKNYEYIFDEAKKLHVPFTIHAGEADGAESIKYALKFGAKRIGHGVRCIDDEALMEYLRRNEITLEVCPTSNLQTQAIKGKHPIEELYRRGILVTINSDNDTVSSTNITEEYRWVLENTGLTVQDLIQMNINAGRCIFAPEIKKANLIGKIKQYKDRDDDTLYK